MAKLYNEMNEDVLAQECQAKAYALDPNSVGGNVEMANMLGQQGKYDEADHHYARALELDPKNPGILLHRAHLLQQAGRFDEAETVCRSASELRPLWVEPYAMIASGRRFTESDRDLLSRLVAISSHEKVSPDERAKAYMSLGKAFDDLGQYEVAMGNFDLANAWYERRLREARGPLNREKISDWNSQVIQTFTAAYFDRHRKLGSESELPVFVVGMIRSGTTLTEQILSSHPLVAGAGELTYWMQHSGDFHASPLQFLTPDQTDRFASEFLAQICRFQGDAARVIDKMPLNYMGLGLIHTVFPRAKIIHCRRHPVDNCLSIYMTPYGVSPVFAHNRSDIVFAYREYLRLMDHWRSVLPSDVFLEIDYERTVSDRENTLRSVTEFLGVDWSDSVLEHQQNQRTVKTPSFWQARQPIYTSSMARWKNYEPWLREFGELLNPADTSDSEGP